MNGDIFSESRATKIADYEVGAATGAGSQMGREETIKAGVELEKTRFATTIPVQTVRTIKTPGRYRTTKNFLAAIWQR
jgi:formyltetrahydrofolate synthetase